jgi:putative ribosome biogenesis GTPase RsgA
VKDFLGQELAVGDTVVVSHPRYRELEKLTIKGFTPKNVRLNRPTAWNPHETFLQHSSQMVKVPQ